METYGQLRTPPKFIYHTTVESKLKGIFEHGLVPPAIASEREVAIMEARMAAGQPVDPAAYNRITNDDEEKRS